MKIKNGTIYAFGNEHLIFETDKKVIEWDSDLTDQSFYVPDSEHVKNLSDPNVGSSVGAYDNSQVTDDIINLRRPGLDRTEAQQLYERIKNDTAEKCNEVISEANQKALAKAEREDALTSVISQQSAKQTSESEAN